MKFKVIFLFWHLKLNLISYIILTIVNVLYKVLRAFEANEE